MHTCVSKLTIIGSYNGLSPGRRQAIIWTNAGILLIKSLGTNFSEISIGIQTFSFKKMHLKMSSGKSRPFCLDLNVLKLVSERGPWVHESSKLPFSHPRPASQSASSTPFYFSFRYIALTPIARFMGPTWGPSGADRTQVGPMLAPWTLLSGELQCTLRYIIFPSHDTISNNHFILFESLDKVRAIIVSHMCFIQQSTIPIP